MMITFHNLPSTTAKTQTTLSLSNVKQADLTLPMQPYAQGRCSTSAEAEKLPTNAPSKVYDSTQRQSEAQRKMKLRIAQAHICKCIQKYCAVCDKAPETYQEMGHLAKKLTGPTQNLSSAVKQIVQCLEKGLDWDAEHISVSLVDVMLGALVLVRKGFANNCFVHTETAARLFTVYLLIAYDQMREVNDCPSSVLAKCISGVIGMKATRLSALAFQVTCCVDFDVFIPGDAYQKSMDRIDKEIFSAQQVSDGKKLKIVADVGNRCEAQPSEVPQPKQSAPRKERATSHGRSGPAEAQPRCLDSKSSQHYLQIGSPDFSKSIKQSVARGTRCGSLLTATNTMETCSAGRDDEFSTNDEITIRGEEGHELL